MSLSPQTKGLLMSASGVLLISPDSLLIRFLTVDFWTIMFLRGSFIAMTLLLLTRLGDTKNFRVQLASIDANAWWMVFLMAISSFFFVAAIQTTSVAHTLIIVGAVPVFAAIFGWLMLGEGVAVNTAMTIGIVFACLILVVNDQQESSLLGDFLALIACLSWAANFVLARRSKTHDMSVVMMLSGCLMAVLGLSFASFNGLDLNQLFIGATLGVLNGLALFLLITAPRYIPAAEVAVFLPVETVVGTLLVWWFLGEYPGLVSVVAGGAIVVALMLNSFYQGKFGTVTK